MRLAIAIAAMLALQSCGPRATDAQAATRTMKAADAVERMAANQQGH